MSLGIQRLGGVAVFARDPAAAAAFASDTLGFNVAGAGEDGSQRLVGHGGPDPIDLVYLPGEAPGMHHASFVVADSIAPLAESLNAAGYAHEREADQKVAVVSPGGHRMHFVVGAATAKPAAAIAPVPVTAAPVCADHVGLTVVDLDAEVAFATEGLGMLESARVGDQTVHLRFPGRFGFQQLVLTRGDAPGVDHLQFTMKNLDQFYALAGRVPVERGPLRHGPGHIVALYVRDPEGYALEFSTEEEMILDDAHFVPRTWAADDPRVDDEW
ncbi:MAG: hypothetical protein QOF76_4555 [Solirubrobacteraceae bacterium]|nr:hypothetical protein [Solirubrobacteraceae bacterium]